ncbi:MAG: YceK/YidQ family lipoprotein [Planctomycetes bacterium]|nr:YceK/YidQ family lipoprotein [Planctomycetota bacterium]
MRLKLISALLLTACCSGCGTFWRQKLYWTDGRPPHGPDIRTPNLVYGGLTIDGYMLGLAAIAPFHGEWIGLALIPPFLVDLPLSLAADTILLPLTIYEQIEMASRVKEPESSD